MTKNIKLFYALAGISLLLIYMLSPLTQDLQYHNFAEQRTIAHIPHFGDVISNLTFVITGIILLFKTKNTMQLYSGERFLFYFFCISCILLGAGSGYYHYNPNNPTLVADRAAMVLGFAVIFFDTAMRYKIFKESHVVSKFLLTVTLFLLTVFYWACSDRLEPYVFAQFFTMFVIVVVALVNRHTVNGKHLFLMAGFYFLAKLFESQDEWIFTTTQWVSGHTLKHIAYAIALYYFGKGMLPANVPIEKNS